MLSRFTSVTRPPSGPYTVEKPRRTDALGRALRQAFNRFGDLPEDMQACLRRIDRAAKRQR